MPGEPHLPDRISARRRPDGWPLMHQSWGSLLFIHWPVEPDVLRPLIPKQLEIDTFEGQAWIALTPFTLWNARPLFFPRLPWLSAFHEINVRTYVHHNGVPGVWFFSLDANRSIPVMAARALYSLPYHNAEIELVRDENVVNYKMRRTEQQDGPRFHAAWAESGEDRKAVPNTLEFFLVERYFLYTEHGGRLARADIHHEAWPLRDAVLEELETDLLEANGLPEPDGEPHVMAGGPVHVAVWPLKNI